MARAGEHADAAASVDRRVRLEVVADQRHAYVRIRSQGPRQAGTGAPSAGSAMVAVLWCVGIALVGYVWSLSTFKTRA